MLRSSTVYIYIYIYIMALMVRFGLLIAMPMWSTICLLGCDAGQHGVTCQKMVYSSDSSGITLWECESGQLNVDCWDFLSTVMNCRIL
jgi:hypothetical protein